MLFNSYHFFIFFPVVVSAYFLLPNKYRTLWLLFASCLFYAAFIPAYLLILFFLIVVDYFSGKVIEETEGARRYRYLLASIIANGGVLFFFKYFNFFNENVATLARFLHWNYSIGFLSIALPIGLSFHTFQSLSYVIEVYRKKQKAERNFLSYALYVMFFPQLVAGPIERPQNLLHQFYERHFFEYERFTRGLQRMLFGFVKKMLIADNLAIYVNAVYSHHSLYSGMTLFVALIFFAIELYCDFSGYADIAIGSADAMGFRLMENFKFPYSATTITEFWRKWHISLSGWIRDYIFTPLAFQWRSFSKIGVIGALLCSFAFVGLWHGASWNYVFFGFLHGVILSVEFLTSRLRRSISLLIPSWASECFGRFYTFLFWCFSLAFFRAGTFGEAVSIIFRAFQGIINLIGSALLSIAERSIQPILPSLRVMEPLTTNRGHEYILFFSIILFLFILIEWIDRKWGLIQGISKLPIVVRWFIYLSLILGIMNFGVTEEIPFIYFQF